MVEAVHARQAAAVAGASRGRDEEDGGRVRKHQEGTGEDGQEDEGVEEQNVVLLQQKNDMFAQLQAGDSTVADMEEKIALLINQKGDQDEEIKELEDRLKDLEGGSEELADKLSKKEDENDELKKNVENLELNLQKVRLRYVIRNFRFLQIYLYGIVHEVQRKLTALLNQWET